MSASTLKVKRLAPLPPLDPLETREVIDPPLSRQWRTKLYIVRSDTLSLFAASIAKTLDTISLSAIGAIILAR